VGRIYSPHLIISTLYSSATVRPLLLLLLCEYASRAAVGCGLLAQIWVILFASVGSTAKRARARVHGVPIVKDLVFSSSVTNVGTLGETCPNGARP